jgi:dolichol-phosphate mannosyltransferase
MAQSVSETALILVPTYNEAENIERLVKEILAQPAALHILVIDDNSPDGTGALADALAQQDARVSVLHRPAKLGLGTAYRAGFQYSMERGYAYTITMDADFSHHPSYLPQMMAMIKRYDVVLGSRYTRGGGTTGWPWTRKVLSKGGNTFARVVLGLQTHDCTAGFRCYRNDALRRIGLESIFSDGYSLHVELTTRLERGGMSIGELPIIFENRRLGSSKISRIEMYRALYTVMRLRFARPSGRLG